MSNTNSKTLNMTEGSIPKLLIVFSIPMLIGNLFQQIYNLVDSIIVGQYVGANALGAIGATGSVTFLFFALFNGVGAGGGIVVAQSFGAGKDDDIRKSLTNVAYFMFAMSVFVCLLAYLMAPWLLKILKTPDEIINNAIIYMRMVCLGLPLVCVYNYFSSMLRALGDSKGPLYFLVLSCIINVFLDILFVQTLNMNVFGAALATVISQIIAGICCAIYALKTNEYFIFKKEDYGVSFDVIKETARLGFPISFQFALIAVSSMGLQTVVNSFGAVAVAAFAATSRVEQIVHQPYQSLSQALATFTGQNYGAKKPERIQKGFRKSTEIMLVMTVVLVICMQLFSNGIMRLFVSDVSVIEMGAIGLKITSIFYAVLGMIYVTRGVQNGIGDAAFAMQNGIVEVIARILLPAYMVTLPIFGVWGIWWSAGLVWFISALFCVLRYFQYKKKMYERMDVNDID